MKLAGTYEFNAPRAVVWEMLQDPDVIGQIMPGSEKLEEVEENKYKAVMIVKVGPVTGRFEGSVELTDLNPPESYTMILGGKGSAGHMNGTGTVELEDNGDETTTMHYSGEAQVGGRIAAVGQRLLDMAGKMIAKQSLKNLAKQVEQRIAQGDEPAKLV